jgi:hypothetical protein
VEKSDDETRLWSVKEHLLEATAQKLNESATWSPLQQCTNVDSSAAKHVACWKAAPLC